MGLWRPSSIRPGFFSGLLDRDVEPAGRHALRRPFDFEGTVLAVGAY
ncbi:MAG TPA: hypothetical protein VLD67_00355 [Vicinamibacterales bacterium]|nr:hypothetical protein [Vicinamibacterales bacterium]